MSDTTFVSSVDFAAGGLLLAAVLIVWRRDLPAIIKLLAWQGVALAAIPIVRGIHEGSTELIVIGGVILVLRALVLPWLLARALATERDEHREATSLVNTTTSLLTCVTRTMSSVCPPVTFARRTHMLPTKPGPGPSW